MEHNRTDSNPTPAVRRLSLYLRELENLHRKSVDTVSSKQLGDLLGLLDTQVRKDLATFGQVGHPGVGYRVDELISGLKGILGTDRIWNVVVVGAGNLGRALCAYPGFVERGFRVVAAFDIDPTKTGQTICDLRVQPLEELTATVKRTDARLGLIAVPAENAQDVADQLVEAGVRGVLNFAPVSISLPTGVAVTSVDLAVQLEQLSFLVNLLTLPQSRMTPGN
jgi:redox-sensing transcriptional repressor